MPHPDLAVTPTAMRAGVEAELVDLEWMLSFVFELVEHLEAGDFASLKSFLADTDAELNTLGRAAADNPADMENIGLLREVISRITAELDTISRSRSRAIDMANAPILHRLKYGVEIEFDAPEVSVSAPVARFGAATPASVVSTETKTLTYDAFNHLIRVEKDGMIATYVYRADGLRHSKTVNGATMTHVWNFGSIVLERNANGAVVNRFHRGLGHLISSDHHGYYLFNVRGDVVQRVDATGNVIHTYRYDAFGNEQNQDAVNTNPFRFAGEYYDWETGFIYLRARFYNPVLGRFISEDPHWNIRNMQSSVAAKMQAANLYMFTMHNPVFWLDPTGLWTVPVHRRMTVNQMSALAVAHPHLATYLNSFTEHIVAGNLMMDAYPYAAFGATIRGALQGFPEGWQVNPSKHFNYNAFGEIDTRVQWGLFYWSAAFNMWTLAESSWLTGCITSAQRDEMRIQSLILLGRGLHPIQDIEAHGNMGMGHDIWPFRTVSAHFPLIADITYFDWRGPCRRSITFSMNRERYNISNWHTQMFLESFFAAIGWIPENHNTTLFMQVMHFHGF